MSVLYGVVRPQYQAMLMQLNSIRRAVICTGSPPLAEHGAESGGQPDARGTESSHSWDSLPDDTANCGVSHNPSPAMGK